MMKKHGPTFIADVNIAGGRIRWTGFSPGEDVAAAAGYFVTFVNGQGWRPCAADAPEAMPDIGRLEDEGYIWDKRLATYVGPQPIGANA